MKKLIIFLLALFLCSNLWALDTPKLSKFDKRITHALYNADDVVLVKCKDGFVSVIEFDIDERVINIATGFNDGWEVIDKENFLFVKPKAYVVKTNEQSLIDEDGKKIDLGGQSVIQPDNENWRTNLIVTTNKNKIYTFDLILTDEKDVNYKLTFNYTTPKQQAKKARDEKALAEKIAKEEAEFKTELDRNNIPRNWDFVMHVNKDSETIAPDFAYDDGVFTYLGFKSTKTIPSVFLYDETNKESILNTHLKKDGKFDVVVIHKTAGKILLRSGDKLVGILNQGYAKNPLDKTYTTNRQNIKREIIE
ncbi:MAG: P-type conjugative transfer protein VirB9 [Campylobacter sp.]|nr:P-type conjugative transfer protein VirB9 [Campylobacter sp.]